LAAIVAALTEVEGVIVAIVALLVLECRLTASKSKTALTEALAGRERGLKRDKDYSVTDDRTTHSEGRCCDNPDCDGCWPDAIDTTDKSEWTE
jgi:hypothetical protein